MRGTYCLIAFLPKTSRIRAGSLDIRAYPAGIYVYVGSALGGIEKRVERHRSTKKKLRWHVDYLLRKAEMLSVIAIPTGDKAVECEVVRALVGCEGATVPVPGFGSSDCDCRSHLIYFGEADPEWIAEAISMRLSMLECIYQRESR